ncbi:transposase [Hymenobacter agri]
MLCSIHYLYPDLPWARIAPLLSGRGYTKGVRGHDNRRLVECVLRLLRNGCSWRTRPTLPRQLGHDVYALLAFGRRCWRQCST